MQTFLNKIKEVFILLKRDEFLSKVVSALGIEYKLMQNITTIVPRVTLIGASAGGKSTLANKCVIKLCINKLSYICSRNT